jgi:DNA polymerase elongation subunit (family B)
MLSYAYPDYFRSQIIFWEYENGKKRQGEAPMPLYFYIEDEEGEYKTIQGKKAAKQEFSRWNQFKAKRDKYREYGMKMYESDVSLQTKFICNHYYGTDLKMPKEFNIFFLDIEVHLEHGFPRPEEAEGKITVITLFSTRDKKYYIFAEKDFDGKFMDDKGIAYQKRIHATEADLLRDFIQFIRNEHPDIITGWNSQDFDIPYIVNRARKILDPEEIDAISPVNNIREEEVRDKKQGIMRKQYFISGINCIDLMEVYKNYASSIKSTYNLDAICTEEIGEGKIKYEGTLVELYNDWQKYIEYNIQDVSLMVKLDAKLGYLNLLITFCYGCKVPFEHYSKTTRVLDGAFISKLIEEQIVLPDVNRRLIDDVVRLKEAAEAGTATDADLERINNIKYVGGFVAEPEKGSHEWICSFDATSLYPSIMIGWNISPETKLGTIKDAPGVEMVFEYIAGNTAHGPAKIPVTIGSKEVVTTVAKVGDMIKNKDYCLAANGTFYRQDFVGVIPKFVDEWFQKRKKYKKQMLDAQKAGDKESAQYFNLLQWNFKILINSVYGYLGSRYSRFYDVDNARAVTLTGQACLKRTMKRLNTFFQTEWEASDEGKKLGAKNFKDFIVYGDTDSVYVSAGRYLKSVNHKPSNVILPEKQVALKDRYKVDSIEIDGGNVVFHVKEKKISHLIEHENTIIFLNETFEPFIQNIIDKNMVEFSNKAANCKVNKIFFKREAICRSAIFVEKKKYAAWLLNDEDNVVADKLKVTGLDIVRSNTPAVAKKVLKDIVYDILRKMDRSHSVSQIRSARDKFLHAAPEDIAFNSPVNGLTKYNGMYEANGKEFDGTHAPPAVKGAIHYNNLLLTKFDLQDKYDYIYNGDKIKYVYMKTGANWNLEVFSFKGKWIQELSVDSNIDREHQFQVAVLNLMEKLFGLMDWELPRFDHHDIASLFKKKA